MIHYSSDCQRFYTTTPTRCWRFIATRIGEHASIEAADVHFQQKPALEAIFTAGLIQCLVELNLEVVRRELQAPRANLVKGARVAETGGFPIQVETPASRRHRAEVGEWGWS